MAYDELLGDSIRRIIQSKTSACLDKKMMGGLVFMINNKMCCGIHLDKKYGDSLLMAKIGEAAYAKEIKKPECLPMDFTGRPMKGFIFVTSAGFDRDVDLEYWIDKALDYNFENHKS